MFYKLSKVESELSILWTKDINRGGFSITRSTLKDKTEDLVHINCVKRI